MKIVCIVAILITMNSVCPSFAAESTETCSGTVDMLRNGQPGPRVEVSNLVHNRGAGKANLADITGNIILLTLFDGRLQLIFEGHGIDAHLKQFSDQMLSYWRSGMLSGRDALHYADLDTLAALRGVTDEIRFREIMRESFLRLKGITEPDSGLFVETGYSPSQHDVKFSLDPVTQKIQSIDFGGLPPGIYTFQVFTTDGLREFLILLDRPEE